MHRVVGRWPRRGRQPSPQAFVASGAAVATSTAYLMRLVPRLFAREELPSSATQSALERARPLRALRVPCTCVQINSLCSRRLSSAPPVPRPCRRHRRERLLMLIPKSDILHRRPWPRQHLRLQVAVDAWRCASPDAMSRAAWRTSWWAALPARHRVPCTALGDDVEAGLRGADVVDDEHDGAETLIFGQVDPEPASRLEFERLAATQRARSAAAKHRRWFHVPLKTTRTPPPIGSTRARRSYPSRAQLRGRSSARRCVETAEVLRRSFCLSFGTELGNSSRSTPCSIRRDDVQLQTSPIPSTSSSTPSALSAWSG